jgi:hypothetical protein
MQREYLFRLMHSDHLDFFKIYVDKPNIGVLLRFYEAEIGKEPEVYEFEDGQIVHSIDEIAEPLMKNYREALARLSR